MMKYRGNSKAGRNKPFNDLTLVAVDFETGEILFVLGQLVPAGGDRAISDASSQLREALLQFAP